MKILSTPIASTTHGITSAIIQVTLIPSREKIPTDVETDAKTIIIPLIPSMNFESINVRGKDVIFPKASDA